MDIEFQVHASQPSIVAHIMGHRQAPRDGVEVAHGGQLTFMGRELPNSTVTGSADTVYFFNLRVPDDVPIDVTTDLLWDLMTCHDPEGLTTALGIVTKTKLQPIDPHNAAEKDVIEAAVRALQEAPIPQSLWLGE